MPSSSRAITSVVWRYQRDHLLEDKFYLLSEYFQAKEHHCQASRPFFVSNCKVQFLFPQLVVPWSFWIRIHDHFLLSWPLQVSLSFQRFFQRVEIFFFLNKANYQTFVIWAVNNTSFKRRSFCSVCWNKTTILNCTQQSSFIESIRNSWMFLSVLFSDFKNTKSCLFLYITS